MTPSAPDRPTGGGGPDGPDVEEIARRLARVRSLIEAVDREHDHAVEIVAVTKGFDERTITAAGRAGCTTIGENYAQELSAKRDAIGAAGVEVHFIGRVQSNKVRKVADVVDRWSSLDRDGVVDEVAKRAPGARVLIQVNSTGEPGKGGCEPVDVERLVERARDRGLQVEGLMTVGPTGEPAEAARAGFRLVRRLVDDLGLPVCSMGMTGDLPVAVEEGSTEVRVGTALFGPRPPRG